MTNKQRTMFLNYMRAPFNETIFTLYRRPSQNKINAYNRCLEEVKSKALEENTIVAHKTIKGNCYFFSFAYFYMTVNPETGEVNYRLHYKTGRNNYDFDVTEEVNKLSSQYCQNRLGIA